MAFREPLYLRTKILSYGESFFFMEDWDKPQQDFWNSLKVEPLPPHYIYHMDFIVYRIFHTIFYHIYLLNQVL